jgi:hypothetical protein
MYRPPPLRSQSPPDRANQTSGTLGAKPNASSEGRTGRVRFVSHRGKQILYVDATNCTGKEVIAIAGEVQRIVTTQPRNSVLVLSDLTGAQFSRNAVTRMKEVAVFDRPYVKKSAMVGTESLPEVFYKALQTFSRREFPRFNTREDAMDWLVREDI